MTTRYTIFESATGDELGVLVVDDATDDTRIVEGLVAGGYLDPPVDAYTLDDGYLLATDGERVVVDEKGQPVVTLEDCNSG